MYRSAPTETVEPLEPAVQPVTPEQSGEHAAEPAPNTALVEPIDCLTIDTDTEIMVLFPRRGASVSDGTPVAEVSPRSRHKSALQLEKKRMQTECKKKANRKTRNTFKMTLAKTLCLILYGAYQTGAIFSLCYIFSWCL